MRQTLAADAPNTSPICAGCSRKKVLSKALASTGSFAYGAPFFSEASRPAPDKALVAQLDRAPDYESGGREFESSRARHFLRHTLEADKRSRPVSCVVDGLSLSTGLVVCHSKSGAKSDRGVTRTTCLVHVKFIVTVFLTKDQIGT